MEGCLTSSTTDICASPRLQGWEMSLSHCPATLEIPGHSVGGLGLTCTDLECLRFVIKKSLRAGRNTPDFHKPPASGPRCPRP